MIPLKTLDVFWIDCEVYYQRRYIIVAVEVKGG